MLMNIEKIPINGHYVWVDKDAEIKESDWYIGFEVNYATEPKERWVIYNCGVGANGNPHYKIIAASPELNLEGVPDTVLPNITEPLPTWDDIRKAIAMGYDWCHQKQIPTDWMIDNFIEQLKQSKK